MNRCQHCQREVETRVYRVTNGTHAWCPACSQLARDMGADVVQVPEWIERQFLKKGVIKDWTAAA